MARRPLTLRWIVLPGLLAVAGLRLGYDQLRNESAVTRLDPLAAGVYRCVRVVEPMGLVVETVGPEGRRTLPFAIELAGIRLQPDAADGATAGFLARQVPAGQVVQLEFDRQRFDRRRRPLAYVLVGQRLVNAELVAVGLAAPDPLPGYSSPRQREINLADGNR